MDAYGERSLVRWLLAGLFAIGVVVWALGKEDHGLPTADLHADAPYYYVYLPSVMHGDLDFTDEYKETKNWYRLGTTPTGKPANVFGVGPAVFDLPVFAIGHGIAIATGSRDDGFSVWEVRGYTLMSLVWSLGAIVAAWRLVRRRCGAGGAAIAGPIACALAGPVVYYAVRQPGYAHPLATFFAAVFVDLWDASYDRQGGRTWRTWVELGAALGAATLARPQLALWGVLLVGAAVDDVRVQRHPRVVVGWLAGALAAFVVFIPQLVAWKVLYGSWYIVPQGDGFMRWDAPCWSEVLFSSRNGLFAWSPAYAVFAVGLVASVREHPRLVGFLVLGVVLQAVANGAAWDWWAGGSFGGRRFDSTYIAFAVGAGSLVGWLVRAWPARDWKKRANAAAAVVVALVVALLVAANLHLAGVTTTTSARISGGVQAAEVFRERVGGTHGRVAALVSSIATAPARAVFAWKHDTGLDVYDRVVGVHVLGDTYPGLNAISDQRSAALHPPSLASGRAHVLVPLNRRGGLDVTITASAPVAVTWNGADVGMTFHTDDLRRGANDLVIEGKADTVVQSIQLSATD